MDITIESDDSAVEEYDQEMSFIADVETTCHICQAEFLDSEDLHVHVKQVHEGSTSCPKICQFCDDTYTDLEDYACHIRDSHLLQLKCCRCCNKCFIDQKLAKKHEKKHIGKSDMYACSQCTGLFTTLKELECHERINHDNKLEGEFVRCMPHLSSILKLKVPALLQADEKVLKCHSCDFTSVDITAYINHLKDDKCIIFVCNKCGDVFKSRKNLIRHLQRKNKCMDLLEYVKDLTTCQTCKNEVHAKQMRAHLKLCKVYICYPCNIRFDTIDDLSVHQSFAHPLELDVLVCKYCPKEYVGQDALDKHVERSHRHQFILYKYKCKSCDTIFKHPKLLFAHYFTKHRDLEPYTCRICDKKFRIRKRFTIHIKLEHKGEGVVEFDDQYHVFFAEKKSENPFIPTCVVPELVPDEDIGTSKKDAGKGAVSFKKTGKQDSKINKSKNTISEATTSDVLGFDTTETEEYVEDNGDRENKTKKPKKEIRKRRSNKNIVTLSSSEEDEAEPLIIIKKRAERKRFQKRFLPGPKKMKEERLKRKQFTCKVCNKYCYTYQNYHNHIKIHSKNESIECVKCSRSFRTKKELMEHVTTDHTTSKLIETLKSVLERKHIETQNGTDNDISYDANLEPSKRFMKTIKRVKLDKLSEPAKISIAPNNLSVKKFIENFIPDVNEPATKEAKSEPVSQPAVTIKHYNSPYYTKHTIKMSKFTPEPPIQEVKLRLPERFKEQNEYKEKVKLTVRLVQQPIRPSMFESYEKEPSYDNTDDNQDYDDYDEYKNDAIPDVAQEVLLEGFEEPPKATIQAPHKIVIPKLPKGYPSIHIATLSSEAPYYKIIKVKGTKSQPIIIETDEGKKTEKPDIRKDDIIRLPDGTKFVTANPLAHLLGNKPVEEVLEPIKNRHYKSARTDFKGLLAEALQNLDKPQPRASKRKAEQKTEKTKKKFV